MGMRVLAKNFKQCAAGGEPSATSEMSEDPCVVKIAQHVLEEIRSNSKEPIELHKLGYNFEGRAGVTGADMDELAIVLNTTNSSGITLNATETTPAKVSKRDVQFDVPVSGEVGVSYETWKVTNVFMKGELELNFKIGDKQYLPVAWRSSAESVLTVVQTA